MTAIDEIWIRDARRVIHEGPTDFFKVEQRKYWFDLILCTTMAYVAAVIYLAAPLFSWQQIIAFPFAAFWLYRGNSMVHEVSHLNKKQFTSFRAVCSSVWHWPVVWPMNRM